MPTNRHTITATFGNGEGGALYITQPTVLGVQALFQDAAGTIPVTADADPVGRVADQSGQGNHATQPDNALRPVYRTDGVRHWLQYNGQDQHIDTNMSRFGTAGLFAAPGERFFTAQVVRTGTNDNGTTLARGPTPGRTFQLHYSGNENRNRTPGIIIRGVNTDTGFQADDGTAHVLWTDWDETTLLVDKTLSPGEIMTVVGLLQGFEEV